MLDRLEKLAVYLHGFRWWFLALCMGVFVTLAILDFRGHETVWLFVLSFMWLFGTAMFVRFFQRTKRLEEAKRMKDIGPSFLYGLVTSDLYAYLMVGFFVFWLGFLSYVTIQVARS